MKNIKRFFVLILDVLYNAIKIAITILRILLRGYYRSDLVKRSETNKVAIFGNGPSLRLAIDAYLHDSSLKKNDIMVLNDFFLSEAFCALKPKYYCLSDPTYFKTVEYEDDNEMTMRLWETFERVISWPMTLVIPKHYYKSFKDFVHLKNSNISVITYNSCDYLGFEKFRFPFYKKNLCSPHCETVGLAAIYIALTIGYKEILIYGMEHSWVSNLCVAEDNTLCNRYEHFWDNNLVEIKEIRHPQAGRKWKIADFLECQSKMFHQHDQMQDYSLFMGAKIINCTPNSMITSYERKPIKK